MTKEDIEGLRKFAIEMIRQSWEGYDVSGADIQDTAFKCGLLYEDVATEEDVDRSEYSASCMEAGDEIYRFSPFLVETSKETTNDSRRDEINRGPDDPLLRGKRSVSSPKL